jgi:hypothetical protein
MLEEGLRSTIAYFDAKLGTQPAACLL